VHPETENGGINLQKSQNGILADFGFSTPLGILGISFLNVFKRFRAHFDEFWGVKTQFWCGWASRSAIFEPVFQGFWPKFREKPFLREKCRYLAARDSFFEAFPPY